MQDDLDVAPVDGWYRLAAAVVKGLPQDDPERERWRAFGLDLAHSLTPAHSVTRGARPGYMNASKVGVNQVEKRRRKSSRISARSSAR